MYKPNYPKQKTQTSRHTSQNCIGKARLLVTPLTNLLHQVMPTTVSTRKHPHHASVGNNCPDCKQLILWPLPSYSSLSCLADMVSFPVVNLLALLSSLEGITCASHKESIQTTLRHHTVKTPIVHTSILGKHLFVVIYYMPQQFLTNLSQWQCLKIGIKTSKGSQSDTMSCFFSVHSPLNPGKLKCLKLCKVVSKPSTLG